MRKLKLIAFSVYVITCVSTFLMNHTTSIDAEQEVSVEQTTEYETESVEIEPQIIEVVKETEPVSLAPTKIRCDLGEFKITFYCCCKKCCGKDETDAAYGICANGEKVEEGYTIAVDPSVIPLNTEVCIEGYGRFKAMDTGKSVKGNHIDMYISDHEQCLQLGVQYAYVFVEIWVEELDID